MKFIATLIIDGAEKKLYASKGKVRVGASGPGLTAPELYESLGKGPARAVRKALMAAGLTRLAAAPRASLLK